MQLLQKDRMQRQQERLQSVRGLSDDCLDDYEVKIVPVEWFDSLEGIDEDLRKELNYKLARVRN